MNVTERADKAKAILDSPLYQEAFEGVRQAILRNIERCPLTDTQTAEDLRRCLKLLRDVNAQLTAYISNGKIESFRVAQDERKNPFRHFFR